MLSKKKRREGIFIYVCLLWKNQFLHNIKLVKLFQLMLLQDVIHHKTAKTWRSHISSDTKNAWCVWNNNRSSTRKMVLLPLDSDFLLPLKVRQWILLFNLLQKIFCHFFPHHVTDYSALKRLRYLNILILWTPFSMHITISVA